MLRKLSVWVVAVACVFATAVPYAHAQGLSTPVTIEDFQQEWQQARTVRSRFVTKMGEAQRICDADRNFSAKSDLLTAIGSSIAIIDDRLREISNSTGDQRANDQRLGVELLFERERLTKLRTMYAGERYVP